MLGPCSLSVLINRFYNFFSNQLLSTLNSKFLDPNLWKMFFILIALVALCLFYSFYWKLRDYPPGPLPMPLFGNLFAMRTEKRFEIKFVEWAKKYGRV